MMSRTDFENGNMKHSILLKLITTELLLSIFKNNFKFCADWLRNNVTLICQTQFHVSALSICFAMEREKVDFAKI